MGDSQDREVSGAASLPYARQTIDDDDVAAVGAALRSGWLTTGPAVAGFEAALASTVGARFAVACSSGTAALHLAALALELKPGARVVVPTMTFLATANAPRHAGAEILFADVDPDTGLMTAADLEAALAGAGDVAAVFPVHLNGQCQDLEAIAALCRERGIAVVHDAAHSLGTRYQDKDSERVVGGDGALCAFSFHPVKLITMGEGGAVTTDDEALAARMAGARNHGISRVPESFASPDLAFDRDGAANPWYYEMAEPGFNYRASDLHCALGLSQLGKIERFIARRRELVERYDSLIAALAPLVSPLARVAGCRPAWHLYVALIDFAAAGVSRAEVMRRLTARGISTMVHYLPVHLQPYYRQLHGARDLPGAWRYYQRALSLPLFPAMSDSDVERVVTSLGKALKVEL